jgi:hypothetical protein
MRKKVLIIGLASVLGIAAIGGGVFYFVHRENSKPENQPRRPENSVDYSPAKPEDSATIESSKDKAAQPDAATKPDTSAPTNQSSVSVDMTTAVQSGKQLVIRALVNGATTGTCNLILSQGGQTISRSAAIGAQANYAICQGFNIPIDDLPAGGDWKISVTALVNGATSSPAEKTLKVEK